MTDKIKEYWNNRAKESQKDLEATTQDIWLRELEVKTIAEHVRSLSLGPVARLADLGCGDGYAAVRIALEFPDLQITGMDYSESMIELARVRLETQKVKDPSLPDRISFAVGDVTDLQSALGDARYDLALTDRCLINLDTPERQYDAIRQIAAHVNSDGTYLAIENFLEGHENMNAARRSVGVEEIPVRWHNLYFVEQDFLAETRKIFKTVDIIDFSSAYYYATRVIYSALCKMHGDVPDYNHEIHRLAIKLPIIGQYSPIRLAVMRKPLAH